MLTAIHIDDDILSLESMKIATRYLPDFRLLASFEHYEEGVAWLENNEVDIVFLDIEMPGVNGIELARRLVSYSADIIFVTAHTGFAIRAFEACALDYLVKPVYPEKIQSAIERYQLRKNKLGAGRTDPASARNSMAGQIQELLSNYRSEGVYPRRIFITMIGEIRVVDLEEVMYFDANGSYTKVYLTSGEVITCSDSIKSYAEYLDKHPEFVRIHRSHLINKQFISSIYRKDGSVSVKMKNGDVLSVSTQRKNEILQQLTL